MHSVAQLRNIRSHHVHWTRRPPPIPRLSQSPPPLPPVATSLPAPAFHPTARPTAHTFPVPEARCGPQLQKLRPPNPLSAAPGLLRPSCAPRSQDRHSSVKPHLWHEAASVFPSQSRHCS